MPHGQSPKKKGITVTGATWEHYQSGTETEKNQQLTPTIALPRKNRKVQVALTQKVGSE